MDKYYRWERLTGSGKVSPNPVDIGTIIIMPVAQGNGIVTLHDGESTSDPVLAKITTGSSESKVVNFLPVLHSLKGLYIDFTTTVAEVLILYDWGKE